MFLNVSPEAAAKRGGFGEERYETSSVQTAVREMFVQIGRDVGDARWAVVDASRGMDEVEADIRKRTEALLGAVEGDVGQLWV